MSLKRRTRFCGIKMRARGCEKRSVLSKGPEVRPFHVCRHGCSSIGSLEGSIYGHDDGSQNHKRRLEPNKSKCKPKEYKHFLKERGSHWNFLETENQLNQSSRKLA